MPTTDFDQTWSVIGGDFGELAKPLFRSLSEKIKGEECTKGSISFKAEISYDETTGDWLVSCSATSTAGTTKLSHKARLDNRQLVLV